MQALLFAIEPLTDATGVTLDLDTVPNLICELGYESYFLITLKPIYGA